MGSLGAGGESVAQQSTNGELGRVLSGGTEWRDGAEETESLGEELAAVNPGGLTVRTCPVWCWAMSCM